MKRIMILMVALVISISVNAQGKNKKTDMAKKVTTEMTQVLELDKDAATKVLALQTEKFSKLKVVKKNLKDDKEALKVKKKEINKAFATKFKAVVGKDAAKKWTSYLKEKKTKKK